MDSNFNQLSTRLGAIPGRLAVADAADASISSSSLDAADSSLPFAPVAVATSAHAAVSDSLTAVAADQGSLLIVLEGAGSSDLPRYTRSLETSDRNSLASAIKQVPLTNVEQASHLQPTPVLPPRKSKQVTGSYPSALTKLAPSVTCNQNPAADFLLQTSNVMVSSAPVQSVQEARALFIQSTTPPILKVNPRQSSLDQFDPLASGQLVVDGRSSEHTSVAESTEENLLKEWDLDFSHSTSAPRLVCPGVTLQPRVMVPPSAVYASMPNLGPGSMRTQYPGYGVSYPSQRVQPWMTIRGVRHQSSAAMLTPNGGLDGTNKCATMPSGLASVPQSLSQVDGSMTDVTCSTARDPALDWTANIDVLLRPHSMDLSSFTSSLSNIHKSPSNQTWEKFD